MLNNNPEHDAFACVLLTAHSQYRNFLRDLARHLKDTHGSVIHLYCATEQETAFWRGKDDDLFDTVTVENRLYRTIREPVEDEEKVLAEARELEGWLDATINEFAVADRHLGRGYALAGFKHPRSRLSEETSYVQMVNGFRAQLAFWKAEVEEKKPTLMLNCGKVAALIGRRFGIPYRFLIGSRHKNFHQWGHNEFFENPEIEAAFGKTNDAPQAELSAPYHSHMSLRTVFAREVAIPTLVRQTGMAILRHVYWTLRKYEKAKGYYLKERIAYLWRRRRDMMRLQRGSVPLSSLEGKTFVYFPLHTEPETALQMLSPEYFYQHAAIAALSRDLPAGVVLAVKETYEAVGRRPTDFYSQLMEFKNVVMLDMMELGLEVARKACVTATITGTGGFEAAVMGKPVISFGRHNQYNFLPHVSMISDETRLKGILSEFLSDRFDAGSARAAGSRYLKATLDCSFDLGNYDQVKSSKVTPEMIKAAHAALAGSLSAERDAKVATA